MSAHRRHTSQLSRWWFAAIILLAGLLLPESASAAPVCRTTTYSSYSVELCIVNPADGATISGVPTVDATITLSGSPPNIGKLIFYLNNELVQTFAINGR